MPVEEEMEVRSAIQRIAVEHRRRYGYRRITAELRRCGMLVNHKRVAKIMREDNLLAVQPRAFVVTTDSHHQLEVYLNLASRMKLTGINQLWVADITYIRLHREFVYLAVILDSFSRKVVGWELDRTLATRLPLAALECAIAEREPPPGLVHHSDRGVQYASGDYVTILRKHQMIPSMSRPANPYDNASCESFMKTLKREEIHANEYRDLDDLRINIQAFIEEYYNRPFIRLRKLSTVRGPVVEIQDMGDSEAILRNKGHLRETAREMIRRDVYPPDGGWNGWLGHYQKALVDAAFALEQEKAKERERRRSRNMGR